MPSESDSPELQKARTFFQYGNDAAQKSNLDYAIDMYKQACKIVPDNLTYRQALRNMQRRKFNNEPSKVGKLVGARNQPIRMRARSARSKKHYNQALEICEEAFTHNPWDISAAREAALLELNQLVDEFLAGEITLADFSQSVDRFGKRSNFWGYSGHAGQMFLNVLMRSADQSFKWSSARPTMKLTRSSTVSAPW